MLGKPDDIRDEALEITVALSSCIKSLEHHSELSVASKIYPRSLINTADGASIDFVIQDLKIQSHFRSHLIDSDYHSLRPIGCPDGGPVKT